MKLAKREKYLVAAAGVVILILLIFQFLVNPFVKEKKRLTNDAKRKQTELQEMVKMSAEYKLLKQNSKDLQRALAGRRKGTTLFSFLEKEADNADVKGHIKYMKPSVSEGAGPYKESMVEMKLDGITLKQLTDYVYRIESPENVISIKRISIKEDTKASGYLDVILQALTFE